MTAPRVIPLRPRFISRYQPPHEWAGEDVERGHQCQCGRWFPQWVVSQAFLDAMEEGRRASFLESCEVVTYKKGQAAWFPKSCSRCERKAIEIFNVKQKYA